MTICENWIAVGRRGVCGGHSGGALHSVSQVGLEAVSYRYPDAPKGRSFNRHIDRRYQY